MLALQPWMPLNPDGKDMLAPSTILHSVLSFMTNTDLQHYSGDQHLSTFSQIFFGLANFFLSASIGFCGLTAIIRALRSDSSLGNFFVDMWRVVMYMFLPIAFLFGLVFLQQGSPMTLESSYHVSTLERGSMGVTDKGDPKPQNIVVGPLAAFVPMKQLGTNGGGFYGMNSAHPFENPTAFTNFLSCVAMMLFPFALVLMYGRMLGRMRHAYVIFSVMLILMVGTIVWAVYFDTLKPNPGLTSHPGQTYEVASSSAPDGKRQLIVLPSSNLPVDQHLGNLEGKEMRFGTSAGATFAALTVDVTDGAVNCEHDSLNPIAAISPMVGMWLNCIFGGKGVGSQAVADALWKNQATWAINGQVWETVATVLTAAEQKKVQALAKDPGVEAEVSRDVDEGTKDGIDRTPTMFITANGKRIMLPGGAPSYDLLNSVLHHYLGQ